MDSALGPPSESLLVLGALEMDLAGHRACFCGRTLQISSSQFELLAILVANHRRVVSRSELSERLGLERGRSVDVMLSMLRREIGTDFVRNVRKRGWIAIPESLAPPVEAARDDRAEIRPGQEQVEIRLDVPGSVRGPHPTYPATAG